MAVPIRMLRAVIEHCRGERAHLTDQEHGRAERILATAEALLSAFGKAALSLNGIAAALRISPRSVRSLFPDIDSIIAEIILRHLRVVSEEIATVALDDPAMLLNRRRAYRRATRSGFGGPSPQHLLYLQEFPGLPDDLREPLERCRASLGLMLGGEQAELAFLLLDHSELTPEQIGAVLRVAGEK